LNKNQLNINKKPLKTLTCKKTRTPMKLIPTTKNPKKTAKNPTTIHNKAMKKKS
jgi:hypothetical protein